MTHTKSISPFILSFSRRRGTRLTLRKKEFLAGALPEFEIALPEEGALDLAALFSDKKEIWLEIGFGGGEHLAAQAKQHSDVGFIGSEPYRDGVVKLVRQAKQDSLTNISVFADDARLLLERLPDASLARVFILFPDPWPKARHHKRRLVNAQTLDLLARVLKPGGELRLATDDADYAAWMLEHLLAEPRFTWTARTPDDFRLPPPDWVITRYQEKAEAQGRKPCFLIFRRL